MIKQMKMPSQRKKGVSAEWADYGTAPESISHVRLKSSYDLFIGGEWVKPTSGKYFETVNPANGKVLAKVAQAGQKDVDIAVLSARQAFESWGKTPGSERARLIYAIARVILERARELAIIETLDNGKPIRETRDIDIPLAARHFFYHAGWADKMEEAFPGMNVSPLGVIGQIVPWNFPLLMAAWKIAPALAAGNTVVLKPAETTSLSVLHLADIIKEVGLPPGVVNIVTGFGDTGAMIVSHPDVNKIAFTGSTEVGRIIRKTTAGSGKKLSLELGGKSPTIVFDDAPIYDAVEGIINGIFFNQGQVCCAGSRLLVQESLAPKFIRLLKERMRKIRIGDPLDKNVDMGAINSRQQLETIQKYVEIGEKEGSVKFQTAFSCPREGFFFPPTLFTEVETSHTIAREEIFGPVLALMTFRTKEEAIELANNTSYGLAASVWTKDVAKMVEVSRALKAGTVWGNGANKFDAAAEFGGFKESGFGREGGLQGLWEYVHVNKMHSLSKGEGNHNSIAHEAEKVRGQGLSSKIWKTPKMLIGGKQVRSESGRYYKVMAKDGKLLADVPLGSRKDIRDAVEAAAKAFPGWAQSTAYLRGQILYRMAEILQSRSAELVDVIISQTGYSADSALAEVKASLRRILYYAGWTDKYTGSVNPVTQTDFNITYPEPMGVVGLVSPLEPSLLALISKVLPAIAMGNAVIALPSELYPLAAAILIEVIDASDMPAGVVNIVTGKADELAPILAEHRNVAGIDFSGTHELAKKVEELSISNMKRTWTLSPEDWLSESSQGRDWVRRYLEFKTVWITALS
jgi:aldehyde dehydrogenase (NAD+)